MSATSDAPSLRLDATREEALGARRGDRRGGVAELRPGASRASPGSTTGSTTLLRAALPGEGSSAIAALDDAASILDVSIAQPRPRFFAFVGSSGLEIGVIGDLLASCFDVNLAVWSGAASEVEDQAVRWVGEFIGYPAAAGAFTSGGTISNVTALAAARERALPGSRHDGVRRPARRPSTARARRTTPSSARRSSSGSARTACASLPLDEQRRLRPGGGRRGDRRGSSRPGSRRSPSSRPPGRRSPGPSTGSTRSPTSASARGVWLHVDGAYGVAAASTPSAGALFAGIERADSVTLDAHKWLYLPKACGVVLVRRREDLHGALAHEEDYIPHERPDHHMVDITLEYSRPFRALKLWLAFRAHGADAIRAAIERNLGQARLLYEEVSRHDDLETLCGPPPLSVVPFRHVPAGVSPTSTSTTPASSARCRRTAASGSRLRRSTAPSACGRASSTTGRPTTTSARSSS